MGVARVLVAAGIFGLLGACGTTTRFPEVDSALMEAEVHEQQSIAFGLQLENVARVRNIAWPILRENAELCGQPRYSLGVDLGTLAVVSAEIRDIVESDYGWGEQVALWNLAPEGPAAGAGLRKGDVIRRWNENRIDDSELGVAKIAELLGAHEGGEVELLVERERKEHTVIVEPALICDAVVVVSTDDAVNAFADGERIIVTSGMVRFAATDLEIAFIISHELAHNSLGHIEAKRGNILIGAMLGAAAGIYGGFGLSLVGAYTGAAAFSQGFESEADYVGVYYLARAGFDIRNAAGVWRRMGARHPGSIDHQGATHPPTAQRYLAIVATVEEIERKRASGQPLIPEMR